MTLIQPATILLLEPDDKKDRASGKRECFKLDCSNKVHFTSDKLDLNISTVPDPTTGRRGMRPGRLGTKRDHNDCIDPRHEAGRQALDAPIG